MKKETNLKRLSKKDKRKSVIAYAAATLSYCDDPLACLNKCIGSTSTANGVQDVYIQYST
jgi:hypothetical protein